MITGVEWALKGKLEDVARSCNFSAAKVGWHRLGLSPQYPLDLNLCSGTRLQRQVQFLACVSKKISMRKPQRQSKQPTKGATSTAEQQRRASSPIAATVGQLIQLSLAELQDLRGESFLIEDPDKLAKGLKLSQLGADLARAFERGELDDPMVGWDTISRVAHELGPRYQALVARIRQPGPEPTPAGPLPRLTLNGAFVQELLLAGPPALGLGVIEEGGKQSGVFALKLDGPLPNGASGFRFGHALYGKDCVEGIYFTFEFYGFAHYHALVDPCSPVVRGAIAKMLDAVELQFLVINTQGQASVFRGSDPSMLRNDWPKIEAARDVDNAFERASAGFERQAVRKPLLNWVCRNDVSQLDLSEDRLDLNP